MKVKKEYIVLILIIVALVFYLTLQTANHDTGELPQPEKMESADIDRMVIAGPGGDRMELVKRDEKWFIQPQGYPADNVKAKNMANAAASLTLTALVSESGSYERYGLTKERHIAVEAFHGSDQVRRFQIGEPAPTFQHTFVLMDGDPNVYHARGQLKRTFEHTVAELRDKTVFDLSRENVRALALQKGDRTIALTRQKIAPAAQETSADAKETVPPSPEIEWQNEQGKAVETAAVDSLLGSLTRLTCDDYLNETATQNHGEARWRVVFKDDQDEHTLQVYAPENDTTDRIAATASATPYPFVLSRNRVENLEESIDKLLGIQEKE